MARDYTNLAREIIRRISSWAPVKLKDLVVDIKYRGTDMAKIREEIFDIYSRTADAKTKKDDELAIMVLVGLMRGNNLKKINDHNKTNPEFIKKFMVIQQIYGLRSAAKDKPALEGTMTKTLSRVVAALADISFTITIHREVEVPLPMSESMFCLNLSIDVMKVPKWIRGQYIASLIPNAYEDITDEESRAFARVVYLSAAAFSATLSMIITKETNFSKLWEDSGIYVENAFNSLAINRLSRLECFGKMQGISKDDPFINAVINSVLYNNYIYPQALGGKIGGGIDSE